MITQLSQEQITEYASDAQTTQQPTGSDYSQGVRVGKTIPAKWWNWLFNAATKRVSQAYNDSNNMLTEMKNVVTDAGLTPSASDDTQLAQAVAAKTNAQIGEFLYDKSIIFDRWRYQPVYLDGVKHVPTGQGGLEKGRIYDIHEANGVYFGVVEGLESAGGGWVEETFAFSYDLVHWNSTNAYLDMANGVHIFSDGQYGVVYLNGYWYVLMYHGTAGSGYSGMFWRLWRSVDLHTWYEVSTYTRTEVYTEYARRPFITVFDNKIYMYVNNGGTREYPVLRYSTDGINWTDVSIDNPLTGSMFPTGSGDAEYSKYPDIEGFWLTYDVYPLENNKYIVGNTLVSDGVWSSLTYQRYGGSTSNAVDNTRAFTPRVQHLRNGYTVIDRLVNVNYNLLYTIIVDPSGNVVFKSFDSTGNTNLYSIERTDEKEYILLGVTNYTLTNSPRYSEMVIFAGQYTEDGVTMHNLPISNCDVVGTPSCFAVLEAYSTSSSALRRLRVYTAQDLTEDISDYEIVSDTAGIISSRDFTFQRKSFCYGGERNVIVGMNSQRHPDYFNGLYTDDFGENWHVGTVQMLWGTQNGTYPVMRALGEKLLYFSAINRAYFVSEYRIYSTEVAVNKVVGHTLYLK